MTIINLSAGMQFASAQALIGAAAPAFTLTGLGECEGRVRRTAFREAIGALLRAFDVR
jgi:hypothetical protein